MHDVIITLKVFQRQLSLSVVLKYNKNNILNRLSRNMTPYNMTYYIIILLHCIHVKVISIWVNMLHSFFTDYWFIKKFMTNVVTIGQSDLHNDTKLQNHDKRHSKQLQQIKEKAGNALD